MRRSILLTVLLAACIDPYNPPEVPETGDLIVIEGILNTTDRIATVKVTHPVVLNSDEKLEPETGATVTITTDAGRKYSLSETSPGVYTFPDIDIANGTNCYLTVNTNSGAQYDSDLVEIRETPPIDSLYVRYTDHSTEILVDTHDDTNKTRFYSWTYVETWEYTSIYESRMIKGPYAPRHRLVYEGIYRCYKTVSSSKILVGTTRQLSDDVVKEKVLLSIPIPDQRTAILYSVNVRQRAVTEAEYNYLTQLQRSTESVGGLFDAQPSQVYGNIKRVSEKGSTAIGYFSGGSYSERRIFHDFYDFPPHLLIPLPRVTCEIDTVCSQPRNVQVPNAPKCNIDYQNLAPTTLIIDELGYGKPNYTAANQDCTDCRRQGGVLEKPSFWYSH